MSEFVAKMTISTLRTHISRVVADLERTHEPIAITRHGLVMAVMRDHASYEAEQQFLASFKPTRVKRGKKRKRALK